RRRPPSAHLLVQGDHGGAAKPDVVLERHRGALDLALARLAAQLPDQLGALGQPGRAERVPLGQQAARRVGHHPAAVGVVTVGDELLRGALRPASLLPGCERAHNGVVGYERFRVVMMKIWQSVSVLVLMAGSMTGTAAAGTAAAGTAAAGITTPVTAAATGIVTGTDSGTTHACVDTPLTITFPSAPVLGTTGSITVHNADGSVADTIDLADPASFTETVGGATDEAGHLHYFSYYPVIISGDTATIYLHHELAYGRTYYVTADPSAFTAAGFAGVSDPRAWRFTTTRRHPRPDARVIAVDSRGRGDFCTVQGAIDAVPAGNTVPRLITVADGTYTELDWVAPGKPHITVRGQSRPGTVIQYANNNTLNSANTTDVCARQAIPVHDDYKCWRSDFSVEAGDFTLADLTLRNTTPYGGSQAEAFRGNADRITLDRVSLL